MADLEALAKRVEAEEPHKQLWTEALYATLPLDATDEIALANDMKESRFYVLLNVDAYLDAADMLRPEGWCVYRLHSMGDDAQAILVQMDTDEPGEIRRDALSSVQGPHAEARARLAAALRAIKMEAGNG